MASRSPHPPYSPPSWLTPAKIVVAALMLSVLAFSLPTRQWLQVAFVQGNWEEGAFLFGGVLLLSGLLTGLVAPWFLLQRPERVRLRLVISSALLSALAGGALSFAAVREGLWNEPSPFVEGAAVGLFSGALVGLCYTAVIFPAFDAERFSSHDTLEQALLLEGACLVLLGWLLTGVAEGTAEASPLLTMAFGNFLLLVSLWRDLCRSAWVARVRAGREPGWRLLPRQQDHSALPAIQHPAPTDVDAGLLDWLSLSGDFFSRAARYSLPPSARYDGRLVYTAPSGEGPYRETEHEVIVACAPLHPAAPLLVGKRVCWSVILLASQLIGLALVLIFQKAT